MRTLASLAALALVACSPTPTPSIAPAPSIAPSTVRSASASADAQIVADAAVPIEDAPAPSSIAPVITIDGVRMVVIAEETDPSWGVGLARSLRHADDIDDSLLALRDVDLEALPADVRARAADRWSLLGPSTCRVHLGTPVLVRRSDGSFAAYGEGEDTTAPVADPRSLDARLWSSGLEVLAAPIVVDEGECAGAEVALPVARPAERTFRGTPALSRPGA